MAKDVNGSSNALLNRCPAWFDKLFGYCLTMRRNEHIGMRFPVPGRYLRLVSSVFGFFFYFGITWGLQAQTKIDSLQKVLESTIDSEEKLDIQLKLGWEYLDLNNDLTGAQLEVIADQLDDNSNIEYWLRYYLLLSRYERAEGNLDEGKAAAQTALKYAEIHKDSITYKARIYNSLGALFDDDSKVQQAIEYHLTALRYAERTTDSSLIATASAGIGRAYLFLEEYDNAKGYYEKAIAIKENSGEFDEHLSAYYSNMSTCLDAEQRYAESLVYLDKAIALRKKNKNDLQLSLPYNNKAYTLFLMKRYEEAEENVLISLAYSDSLYSEFDKMFAYSTYAEILFAQNRIALAEDYMSRSIELSKKNNDLYLAKYNLDLMYNIYLTKGDYKRALEYYQERSVVMDSIYNVRSRGAIEKLALEYETEKKNKAIEQLNAENRLAEDNLKKSRLLLFAFIGLAVLALLVIVLLWSRQKNKRKTDRLVKEALEKSYQKKLSDTELRALRAQM
ncbi:MAG: tetratricopeptide repeat protein, partial [Bacteroidota bacterium]